jgi:4'-phosphopantetheinyl transferase
MTGMVHVCWSPLSRNASDVDWLDATEHVRFDRLQRHEDRHRFVMSRMLLKTLVGRLAEVPPSLVHLSYHCTRCGKPHGRPVVIEPTAAVRWQVSLSHAGHQVMVAVTDSGPVGVDVESVAATAFDGFDDVALTSTERTEVERCPPESRSWARAVYWARKEAVLKATGHGLTVDPAALEVTAPHRPAALTAWRTEERLIAPAQIADVIIDDDHVAAVAVLAHAPVALALHRPPRSEWGQVR